MRCTIALLALLTLPQAARCAAAAESAAAKKFVQDRVERVLAILKDAKLEKSAQKEKVIKVADEMFDLPLMAKLSLGKRHWPKFSPEQRDKFTDLFVTTLKASYADKIDLITDETVEFEELERKSKTKFEMITNVVSADKRYKMIYKITARDDGWRVYDVEIEGISIVRSYGSQYDQFLADHSIKDLLEKMEKKAFGQPKELEIKSEEIKNGSKAGGKKGAVGGEKGE